MQKRNYWLKLKENFFDDDAVRIIEGLPNGDKLLVFYLKLMTRTIKTDGMCGLRDGVPFTHEQLAAVTHTDVKTVTEGLKLFAELGLIELDPDECIFVPAVVELTGGNKRHVLREQCDTPSEQSYVASEQCDTVSAHCDAGRAQSDKNVTPDIELDIEIDIDIEKEKEHTPPLAPLRGRVRPP